MPSSASRSACWAFAPVSTSVAVAGASRDGDRVERGELAADADHERRDRRVPLSAPSATATAFSSVFGRAPSSDERQVSSGTPSVARTSTGLRPAWRSRRGIREPLEEGNHRRSAGHLLCVEREADRTRGLRLERERYGGLLVVGHAALLPDREELEPDAEVRVGGVADEAFSASRTFDHFESKSIEKLVSSRSPCRRAASPPSLSRSHRRRSRRRRHRLRR